MPDVELDEVAAANCQIAEDVKLLKALRRVGAEKAAEELQKLIDETEQLKTELVASVTQLRRS